MHLDNPPVRDSHPIHQPTNDDPDGDISRLATAIARHEQLIESGASELDMERFREECRKDGTLERIDLLSTLTDRPPQEVVDALDERLKI